MFLESCNLVVKIVSFHRLSVCSFSPAYNDWHQLWSFKEERDTLLKQLLQVNDKFQGTFQETFHHGRYLGRT